MMDELMAFSDELSFDLVLLRKPDVFYLRGLEQLKDKGVNIKIEPQKFNFLIKKFYTIGKFKFRNFGRIGVDYNRFSLYQGISKLDMFDENEIYEASVTINRNYLHSS